LLRGVGLAVEDQIAGNIRGEPVGTRRADRTGDRPGDARQGLCSARAGDQGHDQTQSKLPLIVIAGPTASGKSGLALALAAAYGGTIINADALQIYRDLRILTARPDPAAEAAAPHRLYGVLDAAERGSVARWRGLAEAEIAASHGAGRMPIVVGGTGLYLRALLTGLAEVPEIPAEIRDKAAALHRDLGGAEFRRRLAEHDPEAAFRLHEGDTQRLIRAWEVVQATGIPLAAWHARQAAASPYAAATILMMPPRPALYAACDARFAAMVESGGLDEAAALAARNLDPDLPAMKAVGVPELLRHLRGDLTRDAAIAAGQQATRRYAKRQTTWFRHQVEAGLVLDAQFSESLLRCSCHFIDGFLLTHGR
jgi:tRNA dimethylallyltransferase